MSEPKAKDHYFELSLRSVSNGKLNQECPIVREYADTPGELAFKEMAFSKSACLKIVQAVIDAMDEMSKPVQEMGQAEIMAAFEEFGNASDKAKRKG